MLTFQGVRVARQHSSSIGVMCQAHMTELHVAYKDRMLPLDERGQGRKTRLLLRKRMNLYYLLQSHIMVS